MKTGVKTEIRLPDGTFVEKRWTPPRPRLAIIGEMAPAQSMIDGKMYDSRRHYLDHVKDSGCTVVGNDCLGQKDWGHGDYTPPEKVESADFEWQDID